MTCRRSCSACAARRIGRSSGHFSTRRWCSHGSTRGLTRCRCCSATENRPSTPPLPRSPGGRKTMTVGEVLAIVSRCRNGLDAVPLRDGDAWSLDDVSTSVPELGGEAPTEDLQRFAEAVAATVCCADFIAWGDLVPWKTHDPRDPTVRRSFASGCEFLLRGFLRERASARWLARSVSQDIHQHRERWRLLVPARSNGGSRRMTGSSRRAPEAVPSAMSVFTSSSAM